MHILLIFLDGIGLGEDNPAINPFAVAHMPTLQALSGGKRWLKGIGRAGSDRAILVPTDPRLGVPGRPQSATGQATIITGRNVPAEIGEHYGPWPNDAIRAIVQESSLFKRLAERGQSAARLDAFPPGYFEGLESGKRLGSSFHVATYAGGSRLRTKDELYAGQALSPDWTGQGWRDVLGFQDMPVLTEVEAGARMARLARQTDFAMISTWITDEIGHRMDMERGIAYLEQFDKVIAGLIAAWDDDEGLIVLTSDHGNMEDLSIRQHTENDVPTLIIGTRRHDFANSLHALTDISPQILSILTRTL